MSIDIVHCDGKGRIVLPAEMRGKFGQEFVIFSAKDEIILRPKVEDAARDLAELGRNSDIDKYSIKELKAKIRKRAKEEALGALRRH